MSNDDALTVRDAWIAYRDARRVLWRIVWEADPSEDEDPRDVSEFEILRAQTRNRIGRLMMENQP